MMNKLNPVDSVVLDQATSALLAAVRQFKKTPNIEVGKLLKSSAERLSTIMAQYVGRLEKEKNRKIKINGKDVGN